MKPALEMDAAGTRKVAALLRGLDALGGNVDPRGCGKIEDRLDDRALGRLGRDRRDEAAIDLEPIDLELPEMVERGIARPEIVKREADAARGFGPVVPGVSHGVTVSGQTDVDALLSDLGM